MAASPSGAAAISGGSGAPTKGEQRATPTGTQPEQRSLCRGSWGDMVGPMDWSDGIRTRSWLPHADSHMSPSVIYGTLFALRQDGFA